MVLKKDSKQRTKKDCEKIVPHLKQIKFFQEREIPDKNYLDIAQSLTYLELPADAIVFEYGTIGDLFYIILKGSVRVLVPNKDKIAQLEKDKSLLVSTNKPLPSINEEESDNVANLPMSVPKVKVNTRRRSTLMKGFVNTLGNNAIKNLLDEPIFDQVARFTTGKSFGELALRTTKPRAARIVCETKCEFACMCKDDYAKVLQKIEER